MAFVDTLRKYYGFSSFRPGQEEIIRSITSGQDTLALMPTGGGKSLCYQLPALVLEGTTVVVSPLIALMKDQVDALQTREIKAMFINSSLTPKQIKERINELLSGEVKILYIAPERLNSDFVNELNKIKIDLFAVDEAHCVSNWGHDFRPDYLRIKENIEKLSKRPIVAAFTATATPEVKDDIIKRLGLKNPQVYLRGFDRPNLRFFARGWLNDRSRDLEVLRMIKAIKGFGIVYTGTRDKTEVLAQFLRSNKVNALAYHAGLNTKHRTDIQDKFINDQAQVIVATIAFGMGIDKPDVRFVIHANMPASLEGYYQEAGRAGRDGELAYCVLLHSPQDRFLHEFFIKKAYQDSVGKGKPKHEAYYIRNLREKKLQLMEDYVLKKSCRRQMILDYFGDRQIKHGSNCQGCDYCLNYKWKQLREINEDFWRDDYDFDEDHDGQERDILAKQDKEEDFKNIDLYQKLRLKRNQIARQAGVQSFMILSNKVLQQMAAWLPVNKREMVGINGMGEILYKKYGWEFENLIKNYAQHHPGSKKQRQGEKQDQDMKNLGVSGTVAVTVKMYKQGFTVQKIAEQRDLVEATIIGHLVQYYANGGEIDVSQFLTKAKEKEILEAMGQCGDIARLGEIKEKCGDGIEYTDIKWVLAKRRRMKLG